MKNQIVYAKCIEMSVDGLGIAKSDNLIIFVKGLIKGEEAYIKIISMKKDYAYGIIDELIVSSKYRIKSDCPVAYKCGGCDFRHIDYNYQLILKKEILDNILKSYIVEDIIKCDNPYYYRNKVQIPIRNHKMGFYRKFSNDIVENDGCLLENEIANNIINDLKKLLINSNIEEKIRHTIIKYGVGTNEIMLGFVSNDFDINLNEIISFVTKKYNNIKSIILNYNNKETNVILGEENKVLYGKEYIYDIFEGIKVKISLNSFYQINYEQMIKLYKKVLELSDLNNNQNVLDLFCGIGTISLYLSKHSKTVTGIEIVKEAIDNAKANALLNGFNNLSFILEDANMNMNKYLKEKDVVIVDPPRKGLSQKLIQEIIDNKIERVIYVSCNPITLARDLKTFNEYYEISNITPFDLFPFTIHTECVCSLKIRR